MDKISIVIACYNVSKYIETCLNSILKQTYKNIEIIVVNDCSTDDTLKILKKYKTNYTNINIIDSKKNYGLGKSRNLGMNKTTGKYIMFLDSDDYIEKNAIELLHNKAVKENSEIVIYDYFMVYPNKNKYIYHNKEKNLHLILKNINDSAWNKLYLKSFLVKYKIKFLENTNYDDLHYALSYVPYIKNISYLNIPLYHYIQRKNSLANKPDTIKNIYIVLDAILVYYKKNDIFYKYIEELEYRFIRALMGTTYSRICKIKDKKKRKAYLLENWNYMINNFPNWKKNKYLKTFSFKNIFFKTLYYFIYNLQIPRFLIQKRKF